MQRYYDDKEIVVVIDALDEVNGKKYDDLIEEICGYAYDHPEMKMVLSCLVYPFCPIIEEKELGHH